MTKIKCLWICAFAALAAGCQAAAPEATATHSAPPTVEAATATARPSSTPVPFELTSPAFEDEGTIPNEFACTGDNVSPELIWGDPPAGTQSFALIFNDPTFSPGWVHWIVYNIPADGRSLGQDVPDGAVIHDSAVHGANSWGRLEYGGPCPPEGSTHTYIFTLYALDALLDLEPGADKQELLAAMEGHILSEVDLRASFTR